MTESTISSHLSGSQSLRIPAAFLRTLCVAVIALVVTLVPARADEQEDEYLRIYDNIQQADSLETGGKTAAALAKYQQTHSDLVKFRNAYPTWNKDMVLFRINYAAQKAEACKDKLNTTATPASGATATNAGAQAQAQPKPESRGAPTANEPLVKLLEAGAEPRKVLRLQPKAGEKQTVALTMKVAMDQGPLTNLPAVVITTEITINSVSTDGDIGYDNTITDIAVPAEAGTAPQIIEGMKMAFASLKGLSTTGVISNRGFNKRREMKRPPSGNQQLPAAARLVTGQMEMGLTLMTAPLPEEAIGTGGKWEVKMLDKSMNGITKTVYEAVSVEGEKVTTKTSGSIATTGQKADNPAAPQIKGDGKGEVTIDLTRIMPTAGNIDYSLDMSGSGPPGGQQQNSAFKIKMALRLETK